MLLNIWFTFEICLEKKPILFLSFHFIYTRLLLLKNRQKKQIQILALKLNCNVHGCWWWFCQWQCMKENSWNYHYHVWLPQGKNEQNDNLLSCSEKWNLGSKSVTKNSQTILISLTQLKWDNFSESVIHAMHFSSIDKIVWIW